MPTDYDTIADRYVAEIDQRPWNALYERPATLSLLPEVAGKDVLDAGCAHGWYAERLVELGARVVAVDRSARMTELARARLAGRCRVITGDFADLRDVLPDGSCDLVLSSLALHYVENLNAVFCEWARLLRPGGQIVLSTHHPIHDAKSVMEPGYLVEELLEEKWGWLNESMRYFRRPLRSLTDPLSQAGFVIERILEPDPAAALAEADPKGYERLCRLPAFLFVRARKDTPRVLQAAG